MTIDGGSSLPWPLTVGERWIWGRREESLAGRTACVSCDGCEWFSFDVFDTVVTRAVPRPLDVFVIVGERIGDQIGYAPDAFAEIRRAAEENLRRSLPAGADLTLEAICGEVVRSCKLSPRWLTELIAAETQAELDCARPWAPGIALLDEWRQRARFLGFLTDMYLPSETIQAMLERVGCWRPGDTIYASCEEQATKAAGTLFERVRNRLGIDPATWVHFGDNPRSDVSMPRGLSIRAVKTEPPSLARRTASAFVHEHRDGEARALRVAAALQRAAGSAPSGLTTHERRVWELGVHVLAPTVLWYAHSVLSAAKEHDRKNLWFLARDGEIVWEAARVANRLVGFPGGLHYVLASRQGLHLPSFTGFDDEARRWLLANADVATPQDVAQRAGFDSEQGAAWLDRLRGLRGTDQPFDGCQDRVWFLLQQEPHRTHLAEASAEQRRLARSYFATFSGFDALGVVDIGWNANLQCSLQRVLGVDDIHGYYLGLFSRNVEVAPHHTFPLLFDFGTGSTAPFAGGVAVLEALFAGTHPGLVRYGLDANGVPTGTLASEATWSAQQAWGIGLLHDAARAGVTTMVDEGVIPKKEEVSLLIADFLANPSLAEAETLSAWPTQNLQNRHASEPLVPRLSGWQVIATALGEGRLPPMHWEAGGRMLNGRFQHGVFRLARRVSREVKTWQR